MYRFLFFLSLLACTAAVAGVSSSRAADTIDPRLAGFPELRFRLTAERIEAPAEVTAGQILLIEESEEADAGHAFVFRVPDEISDDELAAMLAGGESAAEETPAWFFEASFVGNGDRALPNRPAVALVELKPGRYIIGDPFRAPTEYAQFEAVADTTTDYVAPAMPTPDVAIDLFEMGFNIPDDLVAGRQLWQVTNTGAMLHEIALFRVPSGVSPETVVKAVIAGGDAAFGGELTPEVLAAIHSVGPEWTGWTLKLAGGVGVLSPQADSLAQLDLEPGTYAAVCFIPGPDGTPHFMSGMTTVFKVAPNAD